MIIGGGSGIGLVVGCWMWVEGVMIVVGDVDVEVGGVVVDELLGLFVLIDVCDEDVVNGLFDGVVEIYGCIDIVFNNVGILLFEDNLIENIEFVVW